MSQLAAHNSSIIDVPVVNPVPAAPVAIADCSPGSVYTYFHSSLIRYRAINKSYISISTVAIEHTQCCLWNCECTYNIIDGKQALIAYKRTCNQNWCSLNNIILINSKSNTEITLPLMLPHGWWFCGCYFSLLYVYNCPDNIHPQNWLILLWMHVPVHLLWSHCALHFRVASKA